MNKKQVAALRKIEQENRAKFAEIWQALSDSEKADYISIVLLERLTDTENEITSN